MRRSGDDCRAGDGGMQRPAQRDTSGAASWAAAGARPRIARAPRAAPVPAPAGTTAANGTTAAHNDPGPRSAFDRDTSLRVAAQARIAPAGAAGRGRQRPLRPVSLACIFALVLGSVVPSAGGAAICASQSTARGLATTSATVGTPASFTIEVPPRVASGPCASRARGGALLQR